LWFSRLILQFKTEWISGEGFILERYLFSLVKDSNSQILKISNLHGKGEFERFNLQLLNSKSSVILKGRYFLEHNFVEEFVI